MPKNHVVANFRLLICQVFCPGSFFRAKKKWAMLGLEHWKFPAVDLRRGEEHNILLTGCIAHNNETVNC